MTVFGTGPVGQPGGRERAPMPRMIDLVASGRLDAGRALTTQETMTAAVEAYETFDRHTEGWTKVVVDPVP